MNYVILFTLLAAFVLVDGQTPRFSFSPQVGTGGGRSYSVTGEGRITAVRVWENPNNYIYGFQFRFGLIWSNHAGYRYGTVQEIELFDGEAIVQISGKFSHYMRSVEFVTNRGRTLDVGRPWGQSFNLYAAHPESELLLISGRVHGAITSIAAHWGVPDSPDDRKAEH